MYRYILFDLDGTLTDPKEGITKCVQYALQYFGIEADTEDLVDFIVTVFEKVFHIISWMMPRDIWPLRSIVSVLKISAFLKMAFIPAFIHCCQI